MSPTAQHTEVATKSEPDIDNVIQQLRRIYIETGIRLAIEIGRIILERLFQGSVTQWQLRGRKDVSFRKLERHPDLPFRAATLSRAVAVYTLSRRRDDLLQLQHVNASHLYEITGLDVDTQDRLIDRTESEAWPVQRLRREVSALGGRRKHVSVQMPAFAKWMRSVQSDLDDRIMVTQLDMIDRLSPEDSRALLASVRTLLQQADLLARALSERVHNLDRKEGASGVDRSRVRMPKPLRVAQASAGLSLTPVAPPESSPQNQA